MANVGASITLHKGYYRTLCIDAACQGAGDRAPRLIDIPSDAVSLMLGSDNG